MMAKVLIDPLNEAAYTCEFPESARGRFSFKVSDIGIIAQTLGVKAFDVSNRIPLRLSNAEKLLV